MKHLQLFENYSSSKLENYIKSTEFKEWFGDWENDKHNSSRMLNEDGKPMIFYHGSTSKFDSFDEDKQLIGWLGKGFYFTTDKDLAKTYGRFIKKVFLNIRNPFYVKGESPSDVIYEVNKKYNTDDYISDDVSTLLKENGHDGLHFKHWDQGDMYCCFYANQIKLI